MSTKLTKFREHWKGHERCINCAFFALLPKQRGFTNDRGYCDNHMSRVHVYGICNEYQDTPAPSVEADSNDERQLKLI